MKYHTIKTPTAELLIVELEKGARKTAAFIVDINGNPILDNYTLLGKPDEISDEDAMDLVENPIDKWGDDKYRFLDYNHEGFYDLFTAKESLLSLIESEIYYDVNPFNEAESFSGNLGDVIEAQRKTFDRKRSLIFKKN